MKISMLVILINIEIFIEHVFRSRIACVRGSETINLGHFITENFFLNTTYTIKQQKILRY